MKKIMIVDDSVIIRMRLKDLFESKGFEVVAEAETGEKAIMKFNESKPDIVTMDIVMPGISGIEAVEKLIEINPEVKIIMLSGAAQRTMILKAIKSGAVNYLIKPFQESKVMEVVYEVLGLNTEEEERRLEELELANKNKNKNENEGENKDKIEENKENIVD